MVLVCRGLALACVDAPALPVVLAAFLAPGAPSLCRVTVAPPALVAVAAAALCCFLAAASRGRTWFVRAGGLATQLSERFRTGRKEEVKNL